MNFQFLNFQLKEGGLTLQRGKRGNKEILISLILGLVLIPIISLAANKPPIVDAGSDKEIFENESVILTGSASDPDGDALTYFWSCPKGVLSNSSVAQPVYTAPSVDFNIYYTCVLVVTDNQGLSSSDTVKILVKNKITDMTATIWVRNLSQQQLIWGKSISASANEEILFKIEVISYHNVVLENIFVKNNLSPKMIYQGSLKIDNVSDSRDITKQAINIGNLQPGQKRTITFQAKIASVDSFDSGTTELFNSVLVYNTKTSKSDTVKILVNKTGGVTQIKTGITDIAFFSSIIFPLVVSLLIVWLFKSKLLGLDKLIEERQKTIIEYRAKKLLKKKIKELKGKI